MGQFSASMTTSCRRDAYCRISVPKCPRVHAYRPLMCLRPFDWHLVSETQPKRATRKIVAVIVLSSAWFAGTHRVVQAFNAYCDAIGGVGIGKLPGAVAVVFAGWAVFLCVGLGAYWVVSRIRRVGVWQRFGGAALLLLAVVLISWLYIAIAISVRNEPYLMQQYCPAGQPPWWPSWIPLFPV